jgi:hypothetical protein
MNEAEEKPRNATLDLLKTRNEATIANGKANDVRHVGTIESQVNPKLHSSSSSSCGIIANANVDSALRLLAPAVLKEPNEPLVDDSVLINEKLVNIPLPPPPSPQLDVKVIVKPQPNTHSSHVATSTNPNGNLNEVIVLNPNTRGYDSRSINSTSRVSLGSLKNAVPHVNSNGTARSSVDEAFSNLVVRDPVIIRGAGNVTIFGISNKFDDQFPSQLNAKLAPEEFRDTMKQINDILNKELTNSFKWLIFGSIFCCCTLGCSLLPVIYMNKRAKLCINKLLEMENQRLYLKLGLKWRLVKIKCNTNSLLEYVLSIDFLPTILLYQPD